MQNCILSKSEVRYEARNGTCEVHPNAEQDRLILLEAAGGRSKLRSAIVARDLISAIPFEDESDVGIAEQKTA